MKYEWTGLTSTKSSRAQVLIIFGLGILVVYLTLSALYESFALPFIILLAVPMACSARWACISARVGQRRLLPDRLVMLIGLSQRTRF